MVPNGIFQNKPTDSYKKDRCYEIPLKSGPTGSPKQKVLMMPYENKKRMATLLSFTHIML